MLLHASRFTEVQIRLILPHQLESIIRFDGQTPTKEKPPEAAKYQKIWQSNSENTLHDLTKLFIVHLCRCFIATFCCDMATWYPISEYVEGPAGPAAPAEHPHLPAARNVLGPDFDHDNNLSRNGALPIP